MIGINEMAEAQWEISERNDWHTKSPLECLALIHEEIAELHVAAAKLGRTFRKGDASGANMDLVQCAEEMADILLRTGDLSCMLKIDLEGAVFKKLGRNANAGTRGRRL